MEIGEKIKIIIFSIIVFFILPLILGRSLYKGYEDFIYSPPALIKDVWCIDRYWIFGQDQEFPTYEEARKCAGASRVYLIRRKIFLK